MTGLGETAWVDRHLGLTWERVRSAVPQEDWLPMVAEEGGRAKVYVEYGCGHYGCVMPTYDSNVVAKLTSDESEAFLVAAALAINDPNTWNGMVEYYAIYRLKASFHRRRPLFILWREAAAVVGLPELEYQWAKDDYHRRSVRELYLNLKAFQFSARKVQEMLKRSKDPYAMVEEAQRFEDWAYQQVGTDASSNEWVFNRTRGAQRVAAHLRACELYVELMEHTYLSDGIGDTLGYFLQNGLLLADLHGGNIGLVTDREDYDERIVITDPGHAVPLVPRWDEVVVEEI